MSRNRRQKPLKSKSAGFNRGRRSFLRQSLKAAGTAAAMTAAGPALAQTPGRDEYDYIVIGSGAGGGPVACNLAKAGFRVLILEAGGDPTADGSRSERNNYKIPAFHGLNTEDPAFRWDYFVRHYSDNQLQAEDTKNVAGRGIWYPRAGTLGGCTSHNAMITLYPDNSDWEHIKDLTGDASWNPKDMRSLFERIEDNNYVSSVGPRREQRSGRRHGFNGWLSTEQANLALLLKGTSPARLDPLLKIVAAAAFEAGPAQRVLSLQLNPNDQRLVDAGAEGLFAVPMATKKGARNGTRELILSTIASHPQNLKLKTHALVSRLIFKEGTADEVIGVEFLEGKSLYAADSRATRATTGIRHQVFAKLEVILAGGAFNSPQILMLSGIGPREDLERQGIDVRVDLPGVGRNLQDRYEVSVVSRVDDPFALTKSCTFGSEKDPCMAQYERQPQRSAYGTNGIVAGIKKRSTPDKLDPDLFILGIPAEFRGYAPGYTAGLQKKDHFTWAVLKGHTNNAGGRVALRSSNPLETPEINFHYFHEGTDKSEEDLLALVEGMKYVRGLNTSWPANTTVTEEIWPGPGIKDDSEMKTFIKREAWGHHASCSNKMGARRPDGTPADPMAVVDSQFRVFGTKNLRVVDASVFPRIPGLFIVVPIYMISEKASDVILAEARRRRG